MNYQPVPFSYAFLIKQSKERQIFAPGARVVVRDAEWLVRRVDRTSTGGQALTVVGISELVRDKEAVFLDEIDKNIEILDPAETKLVQDTSSSYQASLLYMESLPFLGDARIFRGRSCRTCINL
jgi:hypothetical protein